MRIAVASGKGGTGKTLVSTNLSFLLSDREQRVTYVDADVEAPNGHLFLAPEGLTATPATVQMPVLVNDHCAGHGRCQEICAFNAIIAAKGSIIVFDELCHSCGACVLACPEGSLVEKPRMVGEVLTGTAGTIRYVAGRLNVGEARSVPLITEVLARTTGYEDDIVVIDAPPGVACSAVAAVTGADLALLVAEPTPFGRHDLALTIEMCRAVGVETAAIINRADLGDRGVTELLEAAAVPILAQIPFDRHIAEVYAAGRPALSESDDLAHALGLVARHLDNIRSGS